MSKEIREKKELTEAIQRSAQKNGCFMFGASYLIADALYNEGYRKQVGNANSATTTGEWEMFSLITSTYYGKQYYFLNEDGSVYSRASHSNMSRDEAINEFLDVFRY